MAEDDTGKIGGLRVAVLATDGFEQAELVEPVKALRAAGATVTVVAPKAGEIQGMEHKTPGRMVAVDKALGDVKADEFDALVLPGGVANPDELRTNSEAVAFVAGFVRANRPIAAICHGPWTLIDANGVRGRKMTSWPSLKTDLLNAGAEWVDKEVVIDGALVTSRKPDDLPAFNREFIRVLGSRAA